MQTEQATKQVFFYPDHGISIEAISQEEADKELEKRIKNLNNKDHE